MGLKVKQVDGLAAALDLKLTKNGTITAATKTKITYDANGLVTAGADIGAADLPTGIDAAKIANGLVSNAEFQYLDGVSSAIQTQMDLKAPKASPTFTGTVTTPLTTAGFVKTTSGGVLSSVAAVAQSEVTSLVTDLASKANKVSSPTLNNIVLTDGNGHPTDSGKKFNDAGTTVNDIWSASKVQTAINAGFGANDAMVYRGVQNCSANPNYPAGVQGETWRVSAAGKIGGASGANVEIGDLLICITDNAGGTHASVGTSWNIVQSNIDGAVTGSDSAAVTDLKIAVMDGTSGRIIKAGSKTIDDLIFDFTVTESIVVAVPTTNVQADTVTTITGFFNPLPAGNAKAVVTINGLVLREGTTAAGYTDCWERSGANLLFKVPYIIESTDVIMANYATK